MKKELRKKYLEIRSSLSEDDINSKSNCIYNRLLSLELFKEASTIMTYINFRDEVITTDIINYCISNNKEVVVPVCIPKSKELILSQIYNLQQDVEIGHFGVLEPKKDSLRPVDAQRVSLILVPGVAFDNRGYRIGYGGGYYDRFLSQRGKGIPTIALSFDCQLIHSVPNDEYDIAVDYILTETKLIHCKG